MGYVFQSSLVHSLLSDNLPSLLLDVDHCPDIKIWLRWNECVDTLKKRLLPVMAYPVL